MIYLNFFLSLSLLCCISNHVQFWTIFHYDIRICVQKTDASLRCFVMMLRKKKTLDYITCKQIVWKILYSNKYLFFWNVHFKQGDTQYLNIFSSLMLPALSNYEALTASEKVYFLSVYAISQLIFSVKTAFKTFFRINEEEQRLKILSCVKAFKLEVRTCSLQNNKYKSFLFYAKEIKCKFILIFLQDSFYFLKKNPKTTGW
jgi:hypothetical protein